MNKLNLRRKLLLLSLFPLFIIMSVAMSIVITLENKALDEEVIHYKEMLITERKSQLEDAVAINKQAVEAILKNSTDQRTAINEIRRLLGPNAFCC